MKFQPKYGRSRCGNTENDNEGLRGLRAAAFIADSLDKSKDMEWIVAKFGGDEQIVNMWISFIKHNGWVHENPARGTLTLTDKGRRLVKSILKLSVALCIITGFQFTVFDPASILTIG